MERLVRPLSLGRTDDEPPSAKPSFELVNVAKSYGSVKAVDNVSLTIYGGEFVALLGPSGTGKTTILMMVAGFTPLTSGDLRIAGKSMVGVSPENRDIGVVFQNYALFSHLRVEQNVSFPLEMRRVPKDQAIQRVAAALDLVGLKGMGRRYPHELSGGQQQRVALARAVVFRPKLLLMDEPLGALDKQLRHQMQHELRNLHRELAATILYVTHDQQEALTMADRVAVMRGGRIDQIDPPERLYREPVNRFVAGFIGDCNYVNVTALERNGQSWQVDVQGFRGSVPATAGNPEKGSAPVLAVRPHQIRLGVAEAAEGLAGRVADRMFLGEAVDYVVNLASGERIVARLNAAEGTRQFDRQSDVKVSWSWAEARIL